MKQKNIFMRWLYKSRPLCTLFLLTLLFSSSLGAWADNARLTTTTDEKYSSFTISKSKGNVEFYLYLMEDNDSYSFWRGNPSIYIDDQYLCSFEDIGIPTLSETYSNGIVYPSKLRNNMKNIKDNDALQGTFKSNRWTAIGSWDPRYYGDSHEYWITISVNIGWNMVSGSHKIQVKGKWCNNGSNSDVELSYNTYNNTVNTIPSLGTFTRKNNVINYSASGFTQDAEWRYAVSMYKSGTKKGMTDGNYNSDTYAYWDMEVNETSTQHDIPADNYQPYTYYPRIYNWKTSSLSLWNTSTSSDRIFYRDFDKVVISGYPRASSVAVETTDAYAKTVKITWSKEISDPNHVDTNGKWYVFRKNLGDDASQEKIGEVAYGTTSFIDNTEGKKYNDTSSNENAQYVYTVCFAPNGWTVNSENDAKGLSASCTHKIDRTFAFSSLTTTQTKSTITFNWNHSSITNANANNKYSLIVQRSTDNTVWSDVKTIEISSPSTTAGSYEDRDNLVLYETYYYRLSMRVQDKDYITDPVTGTLSGGTTVTSFAASRGTYSSTVKLKWAVDQVGTGSTYFLLQRRPLGSSDKNSWSDIYTISGTKSLYSYDDQTVTPGSFYQYRLKIWAMFLDDDGTNQEKGVNYYKTDGFGISSGVVSGRIYYDSGTAVEGVKVSLTPSDVDGKASSQFRSLYLGGEANSGIQCGVTNSNMNTLFGKDFTLQMYLKPDLTKMNKSNQAYLLFDAGVYKCFLIYAGNSSYQVKCEIGGASVSTSDFSIPGDEWTHLSIVYGKKDKSITLYNTASSSTKKVSMEMDNTISIPQDSTEIVLGNSQGLNNSYPYIGYLDEFRLFSKALSESDIKKNYNHTLSGIEDGLAIYWPMDENLGTQTITYDYSKTNNVANGHVGLLRIAAASSTVIPNSNQLSLCAYTDKDGNYMITGVPFSGEGTNYVVTPTMGIHSFNPSSTSRFVSLNSLVFSSVDYKDISSFPVSGKVCYAKTTIPVTGAYIYVDGSIASKDGNPITTASDGSYSVDVPIGDHFVSVKMNGHTFDGDGRYPVDSLNVGTRYTFESTKSNLDFFDNTTVVVAGRVAGGDVENAKPMGLGKGNANIGKAVISLDFQDDPDKPIYIHAKKVVDGLSYEYVQDTSKRDFETVTGRSKAYVASGKNAITIETDSLTGEFAVKLPPLKYYSNSIVIPSQTGIKFDKGEIDATNAMIEYVDSAKNDGNGYDRFKYNASLKKEYRSPSILDIKEHDDGSFGIDKYTVTDVNGKSEEIKVYTVAEDGTVNYTFGHPVYEQLGRYVYNVYAYEKYENKDHKNTQGNYDVDVVPLGNVDVKIANQYASTTSVKCSDGSIGTIKDYTFSLDSLGRAQYIFTAGLPNIQGDYTRTMKASYKIDGSWEDGGIQVQAVILGALSTGNNFTTKGPDEVLMVLRDPPGSQSQTTYEKGTEIVTTKTQNYSAHSETAASGTIYAGVKTETAEGIGFMVIQDLESKANITGGAELNASYNKTNSSTETVTTTAAVSTSDEADYVGAPGDVFIGLAKNLIFGTCHNVLIKKNEQTQQYELAMEDGLTTSEEFTTSFNYTTSMIEQKVIPNFQTLRNSLIVPVKDVNSVARPAAGKDPIYVTTLGVDDENFGTDNDDADVWGSKAVSFSSLKDGKYIGPSYTMILPEDYKTKSYQDMLKYYNNQITLWEKQLASNEEAKVKAINNRSSYLDKNYSLDAGTSITSTIENKSQEEDIHEEQQEVNLIIGVESGYRFSGVGVGFSLNEKIGTTITETQGSSEETTTSTSYTLKDNGAFDYQSIDVYKAPDNYGPIFSTRAGATSDPFEDEIVTKYYKPGTNISSKTLQVEKPELQVLDPIVTGVPAGKDATFRIALHNNSDTKDDNYYGIRVETETNPDGAQVFMDGKNIASGVELLVPYGETIKTLTVRQTKTDVLNYENIGLRFYSTSQPDDTGVFPGIYSIGKVSVSFQPTCSDISLAASTSVINTASEAPLTLSISNYDYSMESLKGVRLEYKGENDADFRTLQEYTKDPTKLSVDKNLKELIALTDGKKLCYDVDLRSSEFTDQTYVFRAVTVCNQGGTEVNNESDEITIVRDMSRPQLIATPTPSTGILHSGDDISITFNEDIRKGSLTTEGNFKVVGILNNSQVKHNVALSLAGSEQAKTEATINLSNKSFSADFWLNYATDGKLFQHGTSDNNFSASVEDGKLVVSIAGVKTASTVTLPKNKWIYLNICFDNSGEKPILNAGFAQNDAMTVLIDNQEVSSYLGNGPISFGGNNLSAKVQEFSLWNTVRSMSDALADKDQTKSQYTSGIVGYWQFNEGHGIVAQDRSRSRNITLPSSNAWWINDENYAVALDGNTAVKANISKVSTTASDSYLLEGWFLADKVQVGISSIMSIGDTTLNIRLNTAGKMELVAKGTTTTLNATDMRDGQWHHLALNVLKSTNGSAIVYVDGKPIRQFSASAIPALQGDALILGGHRSTSTGITLYDCFLKGGIDEVRIWKGRRTTDVITSLMYSRVGNTTEGLEAYYPMEKSFLDGNNQVQVSGDAADHVGKSTDCTFISGSEGGVADATYTQISTPALTSAPDLENVAFSYVASERHIKINLDEQPSKLEGCTIYITAKNIKDLHSNSVLPVTWSVYVNQANLQWDKSDVTVNKTEGETVTFSVGIENQSGASESYTVSGMPTWLSTSGESGILSALGKKTLDFSVASGIAIGTYETTVYLSGSQNVSMPLNITLTVTGEVPQWTAELGESTMNVVGQIAIDNVYSSDSNDILAAFCGQRCVGVASPKYYPLYDSYIVLMDIYGNSNTTTPLTYKMYDASTGRIYPSVSVSKSEADTFVADTWAGSFTDRVIFTPQDKIEQDLSLDRTGWKWFSFYVTPENQTIKSIFADVNDKISIINGLNESSKYENGLWVGNITSFSNDVMYKLNAVNVYEKTVIGKESKPSEVAIKLSKAWSWIGYPVSATNTLDAAFASADPQEGDILKAQSSFAVYTGQQWVGTLQSMTPGAGYNYYSNASADKIFHYPVPVQAGKVMKALHRTTADSTTVYEQSALDFQNNMTMIAVVKDGSSMIDDAQIFVYAGKELRGLAKSATINGKYFLTIGGNSSDEELSFVVTTSEGTVMLNQKINYSPDARLGSMDDPYVIQIDNATSIVNVSSLGIKSIQIYDLNGRLIETKENPTSLFTKDELSGKVSGLYIQKVVYTNGAVTTMRLCK